jgi:capsular exopolysaccharide synthesis family protein
MGSGSRDDSAPLRGYVRLIGRRKWVVLLAAVLAPVAALLFSLQQSHLYSASAEVLVSQQNLGASLTGVPETLASQDPVRFAQTQADLARVPEIAERTLRAAHVRTRTPGEFLAASSVSPKENADILEFTVTDPSPALAVRLATEYAHQFKVYRRQLDTASVRRAITGVQERIAELRSQHGQGGPLYATLVEKEQQLRAIDALLTSSTFLVRRAAHGVQIRPRPVRDGIIGLALGLVLGLGLAFLWEALDTRVRSAGEVSERLGVPLLARVPAPPKRLAASHRLAMLDEPDGAQADAFRLLRTNLEFVNLERRAQTIMVTSAVEAEGKSTTAANLAVALARSGKRVALVNLDLRRPLIERLFDVPPRPGATDVAVGTVALHEALVSLPFEGPSENGSGAADGNGHRTVGGALELLRCGTVPPNVGEFVAAQALATVLRKLRRNVDVVLVDSPPLLHAGDAMALSRSVDALVLVSRLNVLRRPALNELHRVLVTCPAPMLGFVATGAQLADGYDYADYYARADGHGVQDAV